MISIEKYIPELLFRHDCVIIPGFGGFIGNYSPALIDPVYHTFHPPFKSLLFNIHLKQNDGLLASCISQAEQIPYEHSLDLINTLVTDWNQALENEMELVIDKVGKIIKDANGILQFEQDLSVNYLSEAYGLTTLVSPAIRRQGVHEKLEKRIEQYVKSSRGKDNKLQNSLRWAAMMALPIGLAAYLSITNFDQIRNFHQSYTGFLFPDSRTTTKKDLNSIKIIPSEKLVKSATPAINNLQPAVPVEKSRDTGNLTANDSGSEISKPYAIIVGAFRLKENAENLVAKLKDEGYVAGIYDMTKTGLFRVTVGTYSNKEDALEQLAAVRSDNLTSAWLLAKL